MERKRVPVEILQRVGSTLFENAGLSPADAATVTRVQIEADLRGMHSHGMRAVPMYLARIRSGIINPRPEIRVTRPAPSAVAVDGDAGPGQVVSFRAMTECIAVARERGIAVATVRHSNHHGATGYYAMMAQGQDLIGFSATSGNLVLAPIGSGTAVVGNNPMAYAVPAGRERPIVLDIATSVVAAGKINLFAAEGQAIPAGWGIDVAGRPTTDAKAAAAGLGVPLGAPAAGHKGFGLAIVLEVLSAVLSGAKFGTQHTLEVEDAELPWDEGHFFMALDPAMLMPIGTFKERVDALIAQVHAAEPLPGHERPRMPGEMGWERRERQLRDGVDLPGSVYQRLKDQLAKDGLPALLG